jgi:two-component system phosphate regulon sensor histidine kinase PhoR
MKVRKNLLKENKELKSRLAELEDILRAIKSGEVDAFVTDDQQVFTLKSADQAYRILVETINEGAATLMVDGTIMYCNSHLANMLALPLEKIIGSSILDLVSSDEPKKLKSILHQSQNSTARAEFHLKKINGMLLPVLISCNSLKPVKTSLCMVITDLTEQKATEFELERHRKHLEELVIERTKALHESEKRLQIALQVSNSFAFEWDIINDKIIRSDSCSLILGWSGEEAQSDTGKHYLQCMHFEDRKQFVNMLKNLNPSVNNYQTDYRIVRNDGTIVVLEEMGQASFDTDGKLVRLIGSATNITERKKAEDVLKRDDKTLKRLVKEQSHDLIVVQADLEHAKRLSDIGTLAATVAHELRNPLAAMSLAVHNIKIKAKNSDIENNLNAIDRKIAESDQIIDNLLFYSRLKPPNYENINILDIVEECIEAVEHHKKKRITVVKNLDSIKDISIKADSLQIREVFNNILNNALDVVLPENGRIKILSENEDEFISIAIEDNGTGIDKNILDKIFDPFFTTKAKGTGLGLSVCRHIINMHDGVIEVNSKLGQGTSFIVRLRRK